MPFCQKNNKKNQQQQKRSEKSKGDKEKVKLPPIDGSKKNGEGKGDKDSKEKKDRQDKVNSKGSKGNSDTKGDSDNEEVATEESDDATRHDAEALHDAIEGEWPCANDVPLIATKLHTSLFTQ